jgi:PAS domain S-box-containing protein
MKAAIPDNEQQRMRSLQDLEILDTEAEQAFDALTQLASMICGVPISVISLVDADRQWFKSRQGLDATETPRDIAFCAHAILTPKKTFTVPDATKDARFADNPLVTGPDGFRFYAGVPLTLDDGLTLGTLCVIDTKARQMDDFQLLALQLLAQQASKLLDARKLALDNQKKSAQLQQSEQRYRSMLDNLPGTIYRCQNDADWSMLFISDDVEEITGYPPQAFLGASNITFNDLILPQDRERLRQQVESALQQHKRFEIEYQITTRFGEVKWLQELGQGVFSADGKLLYLDGFIWDISSRKEVEQLKNQFVSMVSHELRTPLTSIAGSLGLVLGGVAGVLPEQATQMLQIANSNSERLTHLINDLLDIEKLLAGKMRLTLATVDTMSLLQRCVQHNQPYASRHQCTLQLQPGDEMQLCADEQRLEQIVTNLLSNAAKFSPANSTIYLRAERRQQYGEISVQDQGPGISEEFKQRIFQTFSQADAADSRAKGGTGLGLAICKELAEAMHGSIGYENLPDGCRFFIRLPLGAQQKS